MGGRVGKITFPDCHAQIPAGRTPTRPSAHMSNQPSAQAGTSRVTSGIILAVLSAFSFGTTGFVANRLADQGNPGVVIGFYESLIGLALVLAINVHRAGRPRATRAALAWATLAATGFAIAFGSFYTALSHIDLTVGAPILGAVPLVSYVLILFVLKGKERITRRALIGATLVVAGVGIIGVTST
jgi:drug/metabolite transporter (DMT)-like permease